MFNMSQLIRFSTENRTCTSFALLQKVLVIWFFFQEREKTQQK